MPLTTDEFKSLFNEINKRFYFTEPEQFDLSEFFLDYTDLSTEDEETIKDIKETFLGKVEEK